MFIIPISINSILFCMCSLCFVSVIVIASDAVPFWLKRMPSFVVVVALAYMGASMDVQRAHTQHR